MNDKVDIHKVREILYWYYLRVQIYYMDGSRPDKIVKARDFHAEETWDRIPLSTNSQSVSSFFGREIKP